MSVFRFLSLNERLIAERDCKGTAFFADMQILWSFVLLVWVRHDFCIKYNVYNFEYYCMKVGLVLEGGGMRGLYTAGVLGVDDAMGVWERLEAYLQRGGN